MLTGQLAILRNVSEAKRTQGLRATPRELPKPIELPKPKLFFNDVDGGYGRSAPSGARGEVRNDVRLPRHGLSEVEVLQQLGESSRRTEAKAKPAGQSCCGVRDLDALYGSVRAEVATTQVAKPSNPRPQP